MLHKIWSLGLMHLMLLLVGIYVGGGRDAYEEMFFKCRNLCRLKARTSAALGSGICPRGHGKAE
ncbi:MAG: hypothetical protein JJD98_02645 [Polaromonas sp.]|nr:hypothetical protein [Polaromonas sp.]